MNPPYARLGALVVTALALGLSACTSLYDIADGAYGTPDSRRYPDSRYPDDYGRNDDYRTTSEYRSVERDVDRYTDRLDRALRLSTSQERRVEALLRDRTYDLLRRTRRDEHRYVYPFPRNDNDRYTQRWWDDTDRAIEGVLDRRQRDEHRRLTRGYGYNDRYDRNDDRYDDRNRRDDDGDRRRDRIQRERENAGDYRRDDDRYRRDRDDDDDDRSRARRDRGRRPGESLGDYMRRRAAESERDRDDD